MAVLYRVEHLTKSYKRGVLANSDLSFFIEKGEIFGLLGENGAGKTTLIKQMLNLVAPTSGQVFLDGENIASAPNIIPRRVGYLAQRPAALYDLTVRQAISLTGRLRGLTRDEAASEAGDLVRKWRLESVAGRLVRRLSGGQLQLVGLASAFIGSPDILVLDEPTSELDPVNRYHVWEELIRVNREMCTTIVLVTHNLLEAEKVVHRVAIMRGGKIVTIGRLGDLRATLKDVARVDIEVLPGHSIPDSVSMFADSHGLGPNRWSLSVPTRDLSSVLDALLKGSRIDSILDLTIKTRSLEDVYVAIDQAHSAPPAAAQGGQTR